MREIKFRGKRTDNGGWVYGSLIWVQNASGQLGHSNKDYQIKPHKVFADGHFVIKSTIGQYTGLKDKNGKEIYEGDFLKVGDDMVYVFWKKPLATFALSKTDWAFDHYFLEAVRPEECEVIGNRHENPELFNEKEAKNAN